MQDLKVIENKLVPVYETSTGEKVVYGTELYECLGSKRQYTDWIKGRLIECDAVEKTDYQSFSQNNEKPTGGRPKQEYLIKLDTAKEMAMLERNDKGKQVRRYFIEVEKRYKAAKNTAGSLDGLSPQLQFLINVELKQKEQDAKLSALDDKITRQRETLQTVKQAMIYKGTRKDFSAWASEAISKIAGAPHFQAFDHPFEDAWLESYERLANMTGCRLDSRLNNARKRAAKNGATKAQVKKISKLQVIAADKDLAEHYKTCIREMMIAYCIDEGR